MTRFNWQGLMDAARKLGVMPSAFWRLTPVELAFLLGKTGAGAPMLHQRLNELAAAFPDEGSEDGHG